MLTLSAIIDNSPFFRLLEHLPATGSTNRVAAEAGKQGVREGAVVIADTQTAGRGRRQREWSSPPGSLYCSVLLRPAIEPQLAPLLTQVAGVAVADAIAACQPDAELILKWPNDVLLGGKKVAGILSEMSTAGTRLDYVVVGIGINCAGHSFPDELQPLATCCTSNREEILEALLPTLEAQYRAFLRDGASSLVGHQRRLDLVGRRVEVADGRQKISGRVEGLEADGSLRLVDAAGQVQIVITGDVHLLD